MIRAFRIEVNHEARFSAIHGMVNTIKTHAAKNQIRHKVSESPLLAADMSHTAFKQSRQFFGEHLTA